MQKPCTKHHGLWFIGLVKTAHKRFPKAKLQQHQYRGHGDHCIMQATVERHQYMAIGWNDMKLMLFIACTSRTTDGWTQLSRMCYREPTETDSADAPVVLYYKEVNRPAVVFNVINDHNHLWQVGLGLKWHWQTSIWWHHNFATIIGACKISMLFLHILHFHPNKILTSKQSYREFREQLCLQHLMYKQPSIKKGQQCIFVHEFPL